jgi:hypothetical protein
VLTPEMGFCVNALRQRVQTDCWTHFACRPECTERLSNLKVNTRSLVLPRLRKHGFYFRSPHVFTAFIKHREDRNLHLV